MDKNLRMFIAAALLIGILFLARNQMAWAGDLPVQNQSGPAQNQERAGLADLNAQPGTVKPPPAVVPPITSPGTYSVGGICTLQVEQLADTVSLHALLLPFSTLHNKPDEIERYLAGVCSLNYVKSGKGLTDLAPEDGAVKICFAAIPNVTNKIFVYDDHTWTALDTTVENGLACATASKTGKYVLSSQP